METTKTDLHFKPRPAAVAGTFYPAQKGQLKTDLDAMFAQTGSDKVEGRIFGVVAPHAGYMYSGYVAAAAYCHLTERRLETIAVIAPSHRDYFRGVSLYMGDYTTPLGNIPVDQAKAEALLSADAAIKPSVLGHREEHALEVQLPFLQTVQQAFKILPLVMGTQDWDSCFRLGTALGHVLKDSDSLVVASSDLSHFYPVERARTLDRIVAQDVEDFNEAKFFEDIRTKKCEACGAGPIIAAMIASKHMGATHARVLSYHTSGEISGDNDEVVGYLSGVFYNPSMV